MNVGGNSSFGGRMNVGGNSSFDGRKNEGGNSFCWEGIFV
jgi:hypothetical protein